MSCFNCGTKETYKNFDVCKSCFDMEANKRKSEMHTAFPDEPLDWSDFESNIMGWDD